jgi:hypothetical protein
MTKSDQSSDIKGRLWGCSQHLSSITGAQVAVYNRIDDDLSKIKQDKTIRVVTTDFYTIIFITILQLTAIGCTELIAVFYEYTSLKWPAYHPPGLFV